MNLNKKWSLKWIIGLAALVSLGGMPLEEVFARPGPSRSSSSRGASRSRGARSRSRSTGSRASRGSKGNKAGRGSKASAPSKSRTQKKADRAAYDKAKSSGKAFGNRREAMNKFKNDPANQKKYTSKYASEPTTRPGHIPKTYTPAGGTQTTIIYNQAGGGYGYWGGGGPGLGTFLLYNALADSSRQSYFNNQMRGQGYYYGAAPPTVMSGTSILLLLLVGGGIVVVVVVVGKYS